VPVVVRGVARIERLTYSTLEEATMDRSRCAMLLCCLALLLPFACTPTYPARRPVAIEPVPAPAFEPRLRAEVAAWTGTPYCLGGNSERCLDCSGFAGVVYARLFDLQLPRTTRAIARLGAPVPAHRSRAGDLFFFRMDDGRLHVAIHLGGGEFAHAAASSGVMLSDLTEPYWSRRLAAVRRVLRVD
jgi:cell wall-associated NlpC family hydrolase